MHYGHLNLTIFFSFLGGLFLQVESQPENIGYRQVRIELFGQPQICIVKSHNFPKKGLKIKQDNEKVAKPDPGQAQIPVFNSKYYNGGLGV